MPAIHTRFIEHFEHLGLEEIFLEYGVQVASIGNGQATDGTVGAGPVLVWRFVSARSDVFSDAFRAEGMQTGQ